MQYNRSMRKREIERLQNVIAHARRYRDGVLGDHINCFRCQGMPDSDALDNKQAYIAHLDEEIHDSVEKLLILLGEAAEEL